MSMSVPGSRGSTSGHRLLRPALAALCLLAASCKPCGDGPPYYLDTDGDGYGVEASAQDSCEDGYVAAAGDCDDTDPTVHPGGEVCGDGRDNDCDGSIDESDVPNPPSWYPDGDGDGYGRSAGPVVVSCAAPEGHALSPGDCDDEDRRIHPGANEICDEGIENDCDPATDENTDEDGDGYTECAGDCDDSTVAASPEGTEVCGDGLDNDCDGGCGACGLCGVMSLAVALEEGRGAKIVYGPQGNGSPARMEGGVGDTDGDGLDDFLLDNRLFLSNVAGLVNASTFDASIHSFAFPAGDLDGDGRADLIDEGPWTVDGWPSIGGVGTFLGPFEGEVGWADSVARFYGIVPPFSYEQYTEDCYADTEMIYCSTPLHAGYRVSAGGDVNGDGIPDILIVGGTGTVQMSWYYDSVPVGAYLFYGPFEGDYSLSEADASFVFEPDGSASGFGEHIDISGDLNGDGYDDIVVVAPKWTERRSPGNGNDIGRVFIWFGPAQGAHVVDQLPGGSDADVVLTGQDAYAHLGRSFAGGGDLDGDGADDLLIGVGGYSSPSGILAVPVVQVFSNLSTGSGSRVELHGDQSNRFFGGSLDIVGDVNGDGFSDVLVGASSYDSDTAQAAGITFLFYGPIVADRWLDEADAQLVGERTWDGAGTLVSGAGDVNGDGYDDILISAPGDGTGSPDPGAVYLLHGGPGL